MDGTYFIAPNSGEPKALRTCKREGCERSFTYKRSDKIYCTSNCRKRATEVKQNSKNSPTTRRANLEYWDRANLGLENLLKTPPAERSEWLQAYIDHPKTAMITGNPMLLTSKHNNIAKVANRFTQKVYRVSIKTYLRKVRDSLDKEILLYDYSVFEEPLSYDIIGALPQERGR